MKKEVEVSDVRDSKTQKNFSFLMEATEPGEKLIDAYVGVEFSIVYKIIITCKSKDGRELSMEA